MVDELPNRKSKLERASVRKRKSADIQECKPLASAKRAFDVGNYREARLCIETLKDREDEETKQCIAEFRRRIDVDPVHIASLFVCLALFLGIVITFALR